jgi:alkylation response protein AidB-like acyl-CoA dehydrogenase
MWWVSSASLPFRWFSYSNAKEARNDASGTWKTGREREITLLIGNRDRVLIETVEQIQEFSTHTERVLESLAKSGRLRAQLAPQYGGENLGREPGTSFALFDELRRTGKTDLAAGRIYEGHVNTLLLMMDYANHDQKAVWQNDARNGHWFGVWNTDAASPVMYEREGEHVILHGAKHFCSGAGRVTRALVTAIGESGRQMLIVPMEELAPKRIDASRWTPLGMQHSDSYYVDFDEVRLSADTLLGKPDDYLQEPWFSGGAIRFAAVQFGGVEALAEATYAYIRERGKAQDPFQQYRAGEIAMSVESGRHWLEIASRHHDAALYRAAKEDISPNEDLQFLNNMRMARASIEKLATFVLQHVARSVGANGFLEPLPFSQLYRDLTMYLRQPAPDAVITAIGQEYLR